MVFTYKYTNKWVVLSSPVPGVRAAEESENISLTPEVLNVANTVKFWMRRQYVLLCDKIWLFWDFIGLKLFIVIVQELSASDKSAPSTINWLEETSFADSDFELFCADR
ncbi:hypothetical protein F444_15475 [Phytophthora nicotianae P1976]|uniref:Uncharacterized protein n=1 Tax=Phytophthora nicotianae P1976 TaxID=1317066 RepID=A0A080ZLW1_PHYNI|nr:hypothetical protein F444_15475 [Phytophthora nicotianae P1976]